MIDSLGINFDVPLENLEVEICPNGTKAGSLELPFVFVRAPFLAGGRTIMLSAETPKPAAPVAESVP